MLILHRRHARIGLLDLTFKNGQYFITGTRHGGVSYGSIGIHKLPNAKKVFEEKWAEWSKTVPQVDRMAR